MLFTDPSCLPCRPEACPQERPASLVRNSLTQTAGGQNALSSSCLLGSHPSPPAASAFHIEILFMTAIDFETKVFCNVPHV